MDSTPPRTKINSSSLPALPGSPSDRSTPPASATKPGPSSTASTTPPTSTTTPSSFSANPNAILPASASTALHAALLSSHALPRIESALGQELAMRGWPARLRDYVTALVRTGECSSYDDVMERVLQAVRAPPVPPAPAANLATTPAGAAAAGTAAGTAGAAAAGAASGATLAPGDAAAGVTAAGTLGTAGAGAASAAATGPAGLDATASVAIPIEIIREGIKIVRAEVEKVCDLRVDDVDD
jgi:hypothetical protein